MHEHPSLFALRRARGAARSPNAARPLVPCACRIVIRVLRESSRGANSRDTGHGRTSPPQPHEGGRRHSHRRHAGHLSSTCCTPSANEHPLKADTDDKTRVPMLGVRSKHILPAVPRDARVCVHRTYGFTQSRITALTGPHQTACN
eukprot:1087052-Prymnesium_polylepis.1